MKRTKILKTVRFSGIILFIVLALIFGINLVSGFLKVLPYSYSPITNQENQYLSLFNDSTKSELIFKHAFGSKDDTLYIYNYKDSYRVTIWNLKRYEGIKLSNISLDRNQILKKIENEQYNEMLIGGEPHLNLIVQSIPNNSDFLNIKLSDGSELKGMSESSVYKSYNLKVNEIGLSSGANKECNHIYSFNDICNVNLVFYKKSEKFFVLLINPLKNDYLEDNLLLKMLN